MRKLGVSILAAILLAASAAPISAQVNMQYSGQYNGQYNGQYGGQFSGQYSGQYYGRGSADQLAVPNNRYNDYFAYPTNSGACGELYYPSPGTDNVYHDRQGRRCY
jgi:hypothetical protein